MKKIILALLVTALFTACKTEDKKELPIKDVETPKKSMLDLSAYPPALQEVFTAHGGLQKWSEMKSLTYQMDDQETITNLKSRDIVVKSPTHTIGSINGKVWIAQDSAYFPQERARFYHNLMFYFYAMPFLMADDGIVYNKAAPLQIDGIIYPGIKIGYEASVGDAPDDNYILYYHPKTKQMQWLAYTVTYGKQGASDDFNYIKYNKWQEVNGLLLPEQLTWYNVVNGKPTDPKEKSRVFTKVDIDASGLDKRTFEAPENGVFVNE